MAAKLMDVKYYKVIKKPTEHFPYEIGSVLGCNRSHLRYQYVAETESGAHLCSADFTDETCFEKVDQFLNPLKQAPISFASIKEDHHIYGYLEDYQVRWLLEKYSQIENICFMEAFGVTESRKLSEIIKILRGSQQ